MFMSVDRPLPSLTADVIRESHYDGRALVWLLGTTEIETAEGAPPHIPFERFCHS